MFAWKEMPYLGHILTSDGVKPNSDRITTIANIKKPNTVKEIKSFLGVTGYYIRFNQSYAAIARPLTDLTNKEVASIQQSWTKECSASFETLRTALMNAPSSTRPDLTKPFIPSTDWQPNAIASLECVIAYGSKKLC